MQLKSQLKPVKKSNCKKEVNPFKTIHFDVYHHGNFPKMGSLNTRIYTKRIGSRNYGVKFGTH